MTGSKAWLAWSSGKDAAWALHAARTAGAVDVVGLVTTVTEGYDRVEMHGVRRVLLEAQAAAVGLPLHVVTIPQACPNEVYEARWGAAQDVALQAGVRAFVYGDLFLADVRAYRERLADGTGLDCVFPLWEQDTTDLARSMVAGGARAWLTCVDPRQLDPSFAGRAFDAALLDDLPAEVDPCGEAGEFHTLAWDGPAFDRPIACRVGEVVERGGFVFADVVPVDG